MPLKFPTVTWTPPFWRVRILAAGIGDPEAPFIVSESIEVILMLSSGEMRVVDHDVMLCCRGMDQLPQAALLFPCCATGVVWLSACGGQQASGSPTRG